MMNWEDFLSWWTRIKIYRTLCYSNKVFQLLEVLSDLPAMIDFSDDRVLCCFLVDTSVVRRTDRTTCDGGLGQ